MGSQSLYIERNYTGLAPHKSLTFILEMFYYGSEWDSDLKGVIFSIDGTAIGGLSQKDSKSTVNQTFYLSQDIIQGMTIHNSTTLNFRIINNLTCDSYDCGFGFRQLTIHLSNHIRVLTSSLCHTSPERYSLYDSQCACSNYNPKSNIFVYNKALNIANDSCQRCPSNCEICSGNEVSQCMVCTSGYIWNGTQCYIMEIADKNNRQLRDFIVTVSSDSDTDDNSCGTDYKYDNNSCIDSCDAPYISYEGKCKSNCTSGSFYYTNGSCLSSCDTPYTQQGANDVTYCYNACAASSQVLYSDGTCSTTCPLAYTSASTSMGTECFTPCSTAQPYLYLDQTTCTSYCEYPMRSTTTSSLFKTCFNPCSVYYGTFLLPNQTCQISCDYPWVTNITTTYAKICQNPCLTSSLPMFVLATNSCAAACSIPTISSTLLGISVRTSPCNSNQYLNITSSTCLSSCDYPLTKITYNSILTCSLPCNPTQYLNLIDNTCIASCSSPLIKSTLSGVSTCQLPCQSNQYLNTRTSLCLPSCPSPLIQSSFSGVLLCSYPCSSTQFYNTTSGLCLSNCPFPFIESSTNTVPICSNPCPVKYYLYKNNTCTSTCSSPNTISYINSTFYCIVGSSSSNLTTKEIEQVQQAAQASTTLSSMSSVTRQASSLLGAASPALIIFGDLDQMLKYLRYIDIDYPEKVDILFQNLNPFDFSLSFAMGFLAPLENKFPERDLPDIFEKYEDLDSSFFVNFDQKLIRAFSFISLDWSSIFVKTGYQKV